MKLVTVTVEELRIMLRDLLRDELGKVPRKRKKPYTGSEVDEVFGITPPTRYEWARKGFIDKVAVGGRTYYTADSVERHLSATYESE